MMFSTWFGWGRMPRFRWIVLVFAWASAALLFAGDGTEINRGATEETPSRSEYFSWINNTNEGATEDQTLVNLEFFRWLHDEYGMQLDIYAFDAGAIDGKRFYGKSAPNDSEASSPTVSAHCPMRPNLWLPARSLGRARRFWEAPRKKREDRKDGPPVPRPRFRSLQVRCGLRAASP